MLLGELDLADYLDYENFDPENKCVRCSDAVNDENVDRCVKLRGLP